MSDLDPLPLPHHEPKPSRWPRRLLIGAAILLLLCIVVPYCYFVMESQNQLEQIIEELDRTDPSWHFSDVEAGRAIVPDSENSAIPLMNAQQMLPQFWPFWDAGPNTPQTKGYSEEELRAMQEALERPEPPVLLSERHAAELRAELKRAAAALLETRRVLGMPRGRYPVNYTRDFISTLLPHTQRARGLATLSNYDALLKAQDRDIDGALESCHVTLNVGRSIGDEPLFISMLVRIAIQSVAAQRIERVLAQGVPSKAALERLQHELEVEAEVPLLLIAARGERGAMDGMFEAMQSGDLQIKKLRSMGALGTNSKGPLGDLEDLEFLLMPSAIKHSRAAVLRFETKLVEIAKQPVEQVRNQPSKLDAEARNLPRLARIFVPSVKIATAFQREQARLRCTITALAAERYRLDHGRWPQKLDDLVPGYLKVQPVDPLDGASLRWGSFKEGKVVYSVGFDGVDNNGNLSQNYMKPGTDIGLRLWDVDKRRQPYRPRDPDAEP